MANRLLSIPMGPQLQPKDVEVVIHNLHKDKNEKANS
jgi:dTDP-4-amino-4,6-dideoxygalactose transaminase